MIEAHQEVRCIEPEKSCKSTQVSIRNESSKQGCHPGGAIPVEHIGGGLHSALVQDGGEICDQVGWNSIVCKSLKRLGNCMHTNVTYLKIITASQDLHIAAN